MIEFLTGYTTDVRWLDRLADITAGVFTCAIVAALVWWIVSMFIRVHDDNFTPIGAPVKATGRIKVYDKTNTVNRSTTSHKA